jgi:selenocysteine-specific elongation factor
VKHIVVGTAGHIDHGKSTLVQALTGTDPDRLKEEKARGITIDLGFAYCREGDATIAFVDVPGHERFVRNMLAGVGGIDAVLLVVAADESVMPQTREHFDICRLLAIPRGVVVITKCDLVDDAMLDLVRADIAELAAGSMLSTAQVIAVSARTGAGLDALRGALRRLVDTAPAHPIDGGARLPVDRVFSMRGFGTVVTGTLIAGHVRVNDELQVLPGHQHVKVRGVQVHGAATEQAVAGQRVALNLAGADAKELSRGHALVVAGTMQTTRSVDAWLEVLRSARTLRYGTRVRFHQGTATVLARVSIVAVPAADGESPAIHRGEGGYVRLRLESEAAVTRGDRFVLRSYSPAVTIAGGQVLDPSPPSGGVRLAPTLDRFARLLAPLRGEPGALERDAHSVVVNEAGAQGIPADALTWRMGVPPPATQAARHALVSAGLALDAGDRLVAPAWRGMLAERVLTILAAHHEAQPLSEGLPREEVRERVLGHAAPALADIVLGDLFNAGRIVGRDRLALAGRQIALSPDEMRIRVTLERHLLEGALRPPDLARLTELAAAPQRAVEQVLQLLVRQKIVVRLDGLPFHRDALEHLKADIKALKTGSSADVAISVATFKGRYGLSRKHAIPLLEYLDRERVTRRLGDTRVLL